MKDELRTQRVSKDGLVRAAIVPHPEMLRVASADAEVVVEIHHADDVALGIERGVSDVLAELAGL